MTVVRPFSPHAEPDSPRCEPEVLWIEHGFVPEGRSSVGAGVAWARCRRCGGSVGQAMELPRIAEREGGRPTASEVQQMVARWAPVGCEHGGSRPVKLGQVAPLYSLSGHVERDMSGKESKTYDAEERPYSATDHFLQTQAYEQHQERGPLRKIRSTLGGQYIFDAISQVFERVRAFFCPCVRAFSTFLCYNFYFFDGKASGFSLRSLANTQENNAVYSPRLDQPEETHSRNCDNFARTTSSEDVISNNSLKNTSQSKIFDQTASLLKAYHNKHRELVDLSCLKK